MSPSIPETRQHEKDKLSRQVILRMTRMLQTKNFREIRQNRTGRPAGEVVRAQRHSGTVVIEIGNIMVRIFFQFLNMRIFPQPDKCLPEKKYYYKPYVAADIQTFPQIQGSGFSLPCG